MLAAVLALVVLGLAAWSSWPHLSFWWLFKPLGPNAQGYPEYRHRKTGIVFVRLPGGKFWMGAQKGDPKAPNFDPKAGAHEGPVHDVKLSPFLISKFEVSQADWERVMESNPSDFKGADLPVDSVSWNDCQEFCRKTGLRLPTEAQWECACRAGTTTPFWLGETVSSAQVNFDGNFPYGNTAKGTYRGGTTRAVAFEANGFGLHQTHGNVSEWCEDVHDAEFYAEPEASCTDPLCTTGSQERVLRGGCWDDSALLCRSSFRRGVQPSEHRSCYGLRPAHYPLP